MPKLLQISDLHIQFAARRKLNIVNRVPEGSLHVERRQRVLDTVDTAFTLHPDIDAIFITGDLFDKRQPLPEDYETVFGIIRYCRAKYDVPVYAMAGNHDDQSKLRQSPLFPLQHLYSDLVYRGLDVPGLAISAPQVVDVKGLPVLMCPWGTGLDTVKTFRDDQLKDGGMIFMHVGVVTPGMHWGETDLELGTVTRDDLTGLDCPIGIGHYHGQMRFPDTDIAYCGSLECFNFGEEHHNKGGLVWEFSDRHMVLFPVPSSFYRFRTYTKKFLQMADSAVDEYAYIRIKDTVTVEDYKALVEKAKRHDCLGVQFALRIQSPEITDALVQENLSMLDILNAVLAQDNLSEAKRTALLAKHNEIETYLNSL